MTLKDKSNINLRLTLLLVLLFAVIFSCAIIAVLSHAYLANVLQECSAITQKEMEFSRHSIRITNRNTMAKLHAEIWTKFKLDYAKSYVTQSEERLRYSIFISNYNIIKEHNKNYDKGIFNFTLGINNFSDMTHSEFMQTMTGLSIPKNNSENFKSFRSESPTIVFDLPTNLDWRNNGLVTAVKNQGQCSSCWAFSATGALEGQTKRKTGNLISLSEQQLVDCCKLNHGCEGGWMDTTFECINSMGGIESEGDYPYKAKDGVCHFQKQKARAYCTGYVDVTHRNEEHLLHALATVGPISVAIVVTSKFQSYKSGVFFETDQSCSNFEKVNHAVLIVGYGITSRNEAYWLVKNSWGTRWGDSGYIKMARNRNNNCQIATYASYPLV